MSSLPSKRRLMNWGQFPVRSGRSYEFHSKYDLENAWVQLEDGFVARGMGRCYGDGSLAPKVLSTIHYSHILDLDEEKGVVIAESGITLSRLLNVLIPKGLFLPVTPGTSYVTLGGAVAADVHGKNHHLDGGISNFVESFRIYCKTGKIKECSRQKNKELFYMTIGGMGLTGIILSVKLKLLKIETSFIRQKKENLLIFFNFFVICWQFI